jgi:hypothetical protein
MQTIREQKSIDNLPSRFKSSFSAFPISSDQAKRLKIKEFISWSVCFALIFGLTGLMKLLKLGVTMDSVTSILFYLSLAGLIYFIRRIILLSRNPVQVNSEVLHELN